MKEEESHERIPTGNAHNYKQMLQKKEWVNEAIYWNDETVTSQLPFTDVIQTYFVSPYYSENL